MRSGRKHTHSPRSSRDRSFFSRIAQPSDPPPSSSRFARGVPVAMLGWLQGGVLMAMLVHPPQLMSYSNRAHSFFSRMAQPSDPPPFSSRFDGGVLVALLGWLQGGVLLAMLGRLQNGWNRICVRTRCCRNGIRTYLRWLRARLIRYWHNIPEPPKRDPPYIDLTKEEIRRVLGLPEQARQEDAQQPPPQGPQDALREPKCGAPPAGLPKFPRPPVIEKKPVLLTKRRPQTV